MRFEESKVGNVFIAKVVGTRIDAGVSSRFKADLVGFVKSGNRTIVLDLSDVNFIDSSGLGALIAALKAAGDGGDLVIGGAQPSVVAMFELTRMNRVFRIFSTLDQAVEALS